MKGLKGKKRGAGVKGRLLRAGAAVCAAVCWLGLMGAAEPDEDGMYFFEEDAVVTEAEVLSIPARSSILMDAASGRVLF